MTGTICSVAVCRSNSEKSRKAGEKVSFFAFPKDSALRKAWVHKCYRKDFFDPKTKKVCSKHFSSCDFEDEMQARLTGTAPKRLKKSALPSINLLPAISTEGNTQHKPAANSSRSDRSEKRRNKEIVDGLLSFASSNEENSHTNNDGNTETYYERKYEELVMNYNRLLEQSKETKEKLQAQVNELTEKNAKLEDMLKQYEGDFDENVKKLLGEYLTENQIDLMSKKKCKVRWTEDEIAKAFTLRYFSIRAFKYMRQKLKYPLPGISTLQRWAANIDFRKGLLQGIIDILGVSGQNKEDKERITVLSFDEVKVSSVYEYDTKNDEVVGPHEYMHVVMARGLFTNWKRPVYVAFGEKMSKETLNTIIKALDKVQFNVVACISDCGGGNMGLWKEFGITSENSHSLHPVTGDKIYFFADAPHLLKLVRNWFVDTGFRLQNGTIITKEPINQLIQQTTSEINSCHKLTSRHLNCERSQRQNVVLSWNQKKRLVNLFPSIRFEWP